MSALQWLNQAIEQSQGMTVTKFLQLDKEAREDYVFMMELVTGKELQQRLRKEVINLDIAAKESSKRRKGR
jgi:hypothetical protein